MSLPAAARSAWAGTSAVATDLPGMLDGPWESLAATRVLELAKRLAQQQSERDAVVQFIARVLAGARRWECSDCPVEAMLELWLLALQLAPLAESELVSEDAVQWAVQIG